MQSVFVFNVLWPCSVLNIVFRNPVLKSSYQMHQFALFRCCRLGKDTGSVPKALWARF